MMSCNEAVVKSTISYAYVYVNAIWDWRGYDLLALRISNLVPKLSWGSATTGKSGSLPPLTMGRWGEGPIDDSAYYLV